MIYAGVRSNNTERTPTNFPQLYSHVPMENLISFVGIVIAERTEFQAFYFSSQIFKPCEHIAYFYACSCLDFRGT